MMRQLTLLASLTAKLMLTGLATLFARTRQRQTSTLFCETTNLTRTASSSEPAMSNDVDCGTPETEGDRVALGLCDRCNGQTRAGALWVSYTIMLTLELCGHHDRQHRDALTAQGWERARLDMGAYRQGAPA